MKFKTDRIWDSNQKVLDTVNEYISKQRTPAQNVKGIIEAMLISQNIDKNSKLWGFIVYKMAIKSA